MPPAAQEQHLTLAGLHTIQVGDPSRATALIVLLHGYAMQPQDLAPFAHALGLPALFLFPCGPLPAKPTGHAWWGIDQERRRVALERGARDLVDESPEGSPAARAQLSAYLRCCAERFPLPRRILGGFSQGGMLACDWLLQSDAAVDALLLLSSSRINGSQWLTRRHRLANLPVLISHGRSDEDLSFAAGLALRDFVADSGARVSWEPFDGGHQIPLSVWRAVRKFLRPLCA